MTPIVAIVGRPNVGKSTLFNRLVGRRLAIVDDAPGVTRDRHYADAHLHGRDLTLIDTGGFDPTSDDEMGKSIARHVRVAIDEADAVVCVLDGTLPPAAPDREAVQLLRRSGKPVIYAANKLDSAARELALSDLYELGVPELIPISALHGRGTAEIAAKLAAELPTAAAEPPPPSDDVPRVALIGRPNAGKSSLFNRLSGEERALVDPRPGTTRDPIDSRVAYDGKSYLIVDTAGIRRKSRVGRGVEALSVIRAIRAIGRAEVVVLVCDATEPIAEQDARLLGLCAERGRAIVVGLNQIDRLNRKEVKAAEAAARRALHFAPWAPIVPLSALTGVGLRRLMRTVWRACDEFKRRISTAELNRFFGQTIARRPPPTSGGRAPRIFYVTQAQTAPPLFVAVSSAPSHIRESYRRFLANQIRERFGFESVPVKVRYRKR